MSFSTEGHDILCAKAEYCNVKSTTGCGDFMVASAWAGLMLNLIWWELAQFVTAVATKTGELAGTFFPRLSAIREAQSPIVVKRLL